MAVPITPAQIDFTAGGAPVAPAFEDVFHSAAGGPEQAQAVFLAGNRLPERWRRRRCFAILETGFGLGLNFLCTGAALLGDPRAPARLHYVAVDKHPPSVSDLELAHAAWPGFAPLAAELRSSWPPLVRGFHRLDLAGNRIALTLLFGDAVEMLAELEAPFDAIYLDGFAPAKNPDMWSPALFRQVARLARPGTTAATWSVAANVRAELQAAGFSVHKAPGFGGKRERLAAERPGAPAHDSGIAETAVVIGTGLAGCWIAHALAARGIGVTLLERHRTCAGEASGAPAGVIRPHFNLADNVNARLVRVAFLRTAHLLASRPHLAVAARMSGVLHVAPEPSQAQRLAQALAVAGVPPDYARWGGPDEGARLAGRPVGGPGCWIPAGALAQPRRLCEALLAAAGDYASVRYEAAVARLEPSAAGWRAYAADGALLAESAALVIASGAETPRLGLPNAPALVSVRGQLSLLAPHPQRRIDCVVGGDGFVAPLADGSCCAGATFEPESDALELRAADHAENLARAERLLPGFTGGIAPSELGGWTGLRAATADRLPACGALAAERDGLYLCTGFGARGLVWAPLCADVLAAQLLGEPNPVEASLVAAMDPRRLSSSSDSRSPSPVGSRAGGSSGGCPPART